MKPNLILLHGAIGASSQLQKLATELAQHFTIYIFDFEGHGKNPNSNRNFRIEYFAENLEQFIHQNNLQSASIFGYSMGGYVALYLASQKPLLVNRIFTLATKFNWNVESALKESAMLNAEKIEIKIPHFAEELKTRHTDDWKNVLQKTAEMMIHLGHEPLLNSTILSKINCAVKLTVGENDSMVSVAETTDIAHQIENAEFELFVNFQHPIEKIDIKTLVKSIMAFCLP
jgi:esterase/lipase